MRLGVKKTEKGFRFAYAMKDHGKCRLLLYKKGEKEPEQILDMEREVGNIYTVCVDIKDLSPYEYLYEADGVRVLDPYATGISGKQKFGEFIPWEQLRCTLEDPSFDWEQDRQLEIPFTESVIYCTHLRGYTMDRSSKVKAKGTFQGMIEKIPYLVSLGINQLELMPIYEFDEFPKPKGIRGYEQTVTVDKESAKLNYWGYGDGFYFALKKSYAASGDPGKEFKQLVKELHKAGIELVLEFYFEESYSPGMIRDCLEFWVEEYHIDGVHINRGDLDMKLLTTDPVLKNTKIYTEYYEKRELCEELQDPNARHLAEYHDGFLIQGRRFLKGDEEVLREFCQKTRKNPSQTGVVNYMANHNGFTMRDMVSYDQKHNESNGEHNADGTDYNYSWNCGIEGETRKKTVTQLRKRQIYNAYAMLFFAQGIPLIYGGDEFGNSQKGNNNAYGQDNEISWVQWKNTKAEKELLEYVKTLIAFRKKHDVFHEPKEASQSDYKSTGFPDVSYHGENAWYSDFSAYSRHIGIMYGDAYAEKEKNPIYVAYNQHWVEHKFGLPYLSKGKQWKVIFDTSAEEIFAPEGRKILKQKEITLSGRTICVLEGREEE